MNLQYLDSKQLKIVLTALIKEHPYLGSEVQQLIRQYEFDQIDLKVFKKQIRDLVNSYKYQGFIDWNSMHLLEDKWQALCEKQINQLKESFDLTIIADYACFLWLYSYKLMDHSDDDGTITIIIDQVSQLVEILKSRIMTENNQLLTKKVVTRFLKTAQHKTALAWDQTYWLQQAAEIVTNEKQKDTLLKLIENLEAQHSYLDNQFALIRLLVNLKENPKLENEIPKLALKNDIILNWYLHRLAIIKDESLQIKLLEQRLQQRNSFADYDYREQLLNLYKRLEPTKYYESMVEDWIAQETPRQDFINWLKENETICNKFKQMLNSGKKGSSEAQLNGWLMLDQYQAAVNFLKSVGPHEFMTIRLYYFQRLYQAGLDDSTMLTDFFVESLDHMKQLSSDRNRAILRSLVEIGRVSENHTLAQEAFAIIRKKYPRKYTLIEAIPDYETKLDSKKLRTVNLESTTRFICGENYTQWWH